MSDRHDLKADPAQAQAIRQGGGPCAVIAGPGSGKTYVLVERIRYLTGTLGVDPYSILVLTFSRAAAAQMRSRFFGMCGPQDLVFGTFHSVFYRILQEAGPGKLSVIDPAAKQKYLRHLCSTGFVAAGTTPEELQLLISRYKNGLPCRQTWVPVLVREYDLYLQNRGWLDFDDMILRCKERLERDPAELAKWRARFQWILVDEFQDVSPSQYEVLRLLAAPRNNLFIVGDDDQSIYGFRGADPATMQRFLQEYSLQKDPGRVVFLGTNYRCARAILQAGGSLIRGNTNRIQKDFRAGSHERGSFRCSPFSDPAAEYAYIAQKLGGMRAKEREETAVIFRTHFAAQRFLSVLRENRIPFRAEGTSRREKAAGTAEGAILQDLAAYYRSALALEAFGLRGGGASRKDLLRIMNRPERYLSGSFAAAEKMNRHEILEKAGASRETVEELVRDLELLRDLTPAFSMRYLLDSIGYRKYAVREYGGAGPEEPPAGYRDYTVRAYGEAGSEEPSAGYRDYAVREYGEAGPQEASIHTAPNAKGAGSTPGATSERQDSGSAPPIPSSKGASVFLDSLCTRAAAFSSCAGWLTYLENLQEEPVRAASFSAGREKEAGSAGQAETGAGCVNILTMHACKGLEFDTVFLPDLNEGNIPSKRAWSRDQVEEERRLLYVAMTRARRSLTLLYLEGTPDRPAEPSRFLQPFGVFRR